MSAQTERGIPLCTLNPKFLHTNSTSHTWSFSAIAELIDNAYDPDVKAKKFWIDKTRIGGQDCLTFMDNGTGMDYHKMKKMLSFGYSDKKTVKGHIPVGMYGNGFKSGSMHLGKDAIVFSKKGKSKCMGMLSQTYLQDSQMENAVVPIVTFKCIGESINPESEHKESLQAILRYSLFQTEEELHSEFEAITQDSSGSTGTRIIIWNLCKESEFDFEADRYDIQIPDVYEGENDKYKQSLRAYCSVLYLKPRMQIIIRGQEVKTQLIAKSLAHAATEKYIPSCLKGKRRSIPITFGFNPESQEHYGVMMYHKNRLIKAYEHVRCQNRANKKGVGVIAVIECNFLTPTHNKQDFNCTEEYRNTMKTLDKKLEEYWNVMYNKIGQNGTVPLENILEHPKQNWVQCDDCRKWRKLPDVTDTEKLPEKWFCQMNSDKRFRSCDEPEEREDSEDETYQQEKKNLKIQQKLKKKQMEEEKRNAEIKALTRAEEKLISELRQTGPFQPSLPTASLRTDITARSPIDFSASLQSASSSSDNMQVTSHSLLTRTKRSLGQTNSQALKKKRALNDYCNSPDSPSTFTFTSDVLTSQMEITDNTDSLEEVDSNTDDDDVVVIGETSMTRPKALTSNFDKVKLERSTSNDVHNSDDVSMETPSTEDARDATMDPSTSNSQASMTDQAECSMTVKMEEEPHRRREEVEIKGEEMENDVTRMEQSHTEVEFRNNKGTKMNRSITEDSIERCSSAAIESKPSLAEGSDRSTDGTSPMPEEAAMGSSLNIYNMPTLEAQKQQDSLLELMEATAKEREVYKMQAQALALKLKNKECELLKLTVKKEFSHQNIQTDPLKEQDYKTLYLEETRHNEQLTKTINEMKKKQEEMLLQMKAEKEAQDKMKAEGAGPSAMPNVEDKRESNESPAGGENAVKAAKRKRSLGQTESTSRAREKSRAHNDYCNNAPDSPSMSTFVPDVLTSQMEIPDNDSADKEEVESTVYDDDVVINENKSTPKPKDTFC